MTETAHQITTWTPPARSPSRPGPIVAIVDALSGRPIGLTPPALFAAVRDTGGELAIDTALTSLILARVVERTGRDRFRLTEQARRGLQR